MLSDSISRDAVMKTLLDISWFLEGEDLSDDFVERNKLVSLCAEFCREHSSRLRKLNEGQKRKRAIRDAVQNAIYEEFGRSAVRYAVIKGESFERTIYGNLPLRDIGDIDLLVKDKDAKRAHELLLAMGYRQQLGPSSGSMHSDRKAAFVAKISRQKIFSSSCPVKRFPYKDSYCPYLKEGQPTIELHDGFRGLPKWYTDAIVDRASKNEDSLVQDEIDVLILLLINTYENAESLYSNYFDDKVVLRDFIDLACLLILKKDCFGWDLIQDLVFELEIAGKVGRVLGDLDALFPGRCEPCLDAIPRLKSLWGLSITERLLSDEERRRAVLVVFRKEVTELSTRSRVGFRSSSVFGESFVQYAAGSPTFEFAKGEDGAELLIYDGGEELREGVAIVACMFDLGGVNPPLSTRIIVRCERGKDEAYMHDFDRLPDGILMWSEAGQPLNLRRYQNGIAVLIPRHECTLLFNREIAVMSCVYDRHYEDVYWTRCRGKSFLSCGVPMGLLSRFEDISAKCVHIDFSFGRYVVTSESPTLADCLLGLFELSGAGMPIDCDGKMVRSVAIEMNGSSGYNIRTEGVIVASNLDEERVLGQIIQDIAGWCAQEISRDALIVHAASNLVEDEVVLLMGTSGSGKTTLSLMLADAWPLRNDECACVDMDSATSWAYPYPVNLKFENPVADGVARNAESVTCRFADGLATRFYKRCAFCSDRESAAKRRIAAIVFPKYDESCLLVEVNKVEEDKLVEMVLESIAGFSEPCRNFRGFIHMVAENDIPLVEVRYASAQRAAAYLVDHAKNLGSA